MSHLLIQQHRIISTSSQFCSCSLLPISYFQISPAFDLCTPLSEMSIHDDNGQEAGPSRRPAQQGEPPRGVGPANQVQVPFLVLSGNRTMDILQGPYQGAPFAAPANGVHIHFRHIKEEMNRETGVLEEKLVEISVPPHQWRIIMGEKDQANAAISRLRLCPVNDVQKEHYRRLAYLRGFYVQKLEGTIFVHIRDQYRAREGQREGQITFAKKGIALTVAKWERIQDLEDQINHRIAELQRNA